jgi:PIN domain nuclease of toxin-antitoxin system
VKVLLDTLILVWWLADDPRLPSAVVDIIADRDTDVFVSAATAWEISIKRAAGRLEAPDDFLDAVAANEFVTLAVSAEHAMAAGRLPPRLANPFDRVLLVQAQVETLTLVSVDPRFSEYEVDLLPLN